MRGKAQINWTTFKLPTVFVNTLDEYLEEHRHEGYTTRSDIIKAALRNFMNLNIGEGGNENGKNNSIPLPNTNKKLPENK